jgi:hypothetical protein
MGGLGLKTGDVVEIRSLEEILATLDGTGSINGLPFMPEMMRYCGLRARVYKRADKACDTIHYGGSRRMHDAVHLENLRCDGRAHGGCDAWCLMYWKEAWLKRAEPGKGDLHDVGRSQASSGPQKIPALLERATWQPASTNEVPLHRCQVTDLLRATEPMRWWDPRQFYRDVRSGNVRLREVFSAIGFRLFRTWLQRGRGYGASLAAYNKFQRWRGGVPFPHVHGRLDQTPKESLDLRPGELVQVKSQEEILATVNTRNRNRGLSFDAEMVPYCGGVFRVASRVEQIIDEPTGKMVRMKGDCIILDGVICTSRYSHKRLFCPRSIPPFWREIWLRRVDSDASASVAHVEAPTGEVTGRSDERSSHERPPHSV